MVLIYLILRIILIEGHIRVIKNNFLLSFDNAHTLWISKNECEPLSPYRVDLALMSVCNREYDSGYIGVCWTLLEEDISGS